MGTIVFNHDEIRRFQEEIPARIRARVDINYPSGATRRIQLTMADVFSETLAEARSPVTYESLYVGEESVLTKTARKALHALEFGGDPQSEGGDLVGLLLDFADEILQARDRGIT